MAAFLDVCRFNPTAGGTTNWTYSSPVTGYQSPALAGAVNSRVYKYRAESADLTQWELGEGAYNTGTGVLARTTVLYNSSGTGTGAGQSGAGTKINFSTVPQVAVDALKEDLISIEEANTFTSAQALQALTNIAGRLSVVVQKFTASGTYTPTAGMKYAIIECVGPGGGGGGVANGGATASSSGAGGSGAWSRKLVTAADIGVSKAVVVGTGGAGGAAAAGNGAAGSAATSVGALCVANAGSGGTGVTSGAGAGVGGTGGAASGIGDLSYSGVPGQSGFNSTIITFVVNPANGPSTPYGAGGKAAAASVAPGTCDGWGGGGAAVSVANGSGSIAGGAGADGGVLITEFVQN